MAVHRLTSITLGVPDVAASTSFFDSFGLHDDGDGWLSTADGGRQLELVDTPVRGLRRLGVGVESPDDLVRIAAAAERLHAGSVSAHGDDHLHLAEPVTGLLIDVSIAEPLAAAVTSSTPTNAPGHIDRHDAPAPMVLRDEPVTPSNLTHLVYGTPDQPATLGFFTEVLGFEISDQLPGIVAFTRCSEVHHNLAIQAAPVGFVHHIAFEVEDADEVARGGTAMTIDDPQRHMWGMGRHAIGSNWFWYLREPGGTFVEYTADIDRISSQELYQPKEWGGHEFLYAAGPPPPTQFLEPEDMAELIAAAG